VWIDKVNTIARGGPETPPRSGKGSSAAAWRSYAEALGFDLPSSLTRAQIIETLGNRPGEWDEWHPLAREWFRSLSESAQRQLYEPSDWVTARILTELLSRALKAGKLTASLIERWQVGATELLTTEGARRRMRLELEAAPPADPAEEAAVADLNEYRKRLAD
jgi:hypothetical protein